MADATPAPAARGGATVVANTLHVLQAKVVTLTPAPMKEAAGRTRAAFKAKPWMTTAVALSVSSFVLNLIAFFVRWVTYGNGAAVRNPCFMCVAHDCSSVRAYFLPLCFPLPPGDRLYFPYRGEQLLHTRHADPVRPRVRMHRVPTAE